MRIAEGYEMMGMARGTGHTTGLAVARPFAVGNARCRVLR